MKKIVAITNQSLNYGNTEYLEGATITNVNFDGDLMMLTIKTAKGYWTEIQIRKEEISNWKN